MLRPGWQGLPLFFPASPSASASKVRNSGVATRAPVASNAAKPLRMWAIPVVASPFLGIGPTLKNPAKGRPLGESVFTRERHAIIAVGADGGDIPGEDGAAWPARQRAWQRVWACPSSRLYASARSAARAD